MKTREDFVSNSSSCSFIIANDGGRVKDAVTVFHETFSNCEIPYEVEDALRMSCSVKNKWFREVEEELHGESQYEPYYGDWRTGQMKKKDPEEVSWNTIELTASSFEKLAERQDLADKIDSISFSCEDSSMTGMVFLRLFYAFFERNGCMPDATGTEHSFLRDVSEDDFLYKLTTTCSEKRQDEEKKI